MLQHVIKIIQGAVEILTDDNDTQRLTMLQASAHDEFKRAADRLEREAKLGGGDEQDN